MPQMATPHDGLPHEGLPHEGLPDEGPPLLECRGLDVCVESRTLVAGLDLQVSSGRVLAILGPNGSGKSLSLHTFAGLRPPKAGKLLVAGRPLNEWRRRNLARELAFLPQNVEDPFPATVLEVVLLGRHPHIPRWQWESARDLAIASESLGAVGLKGYEERSVFTLSGGERRRAALAAVLAQTPRIFLLDEPTNQLDPNHQLEALQLLRARADAGGAVIVTLHDPNLAARFADDALLIGGHGHWQYGRVDDVLTAEHLSGLYATRFEAANVGDRRVFFQA
jgi:iron complex transport system ATP-binding protein